MMEEKVEDAVQKGSYGAEKSGESNDASLKINNQKKKRSKV